MDLSISPKTSANGSLPKPKELPKSLKNMLAKERKALTSIEEATLQFKKDKNKDEFLKKHDNQFAIIESCHVFIADLGAQPEASTDILEILTELKLRKLVLNRHYDAVVDLVSGKSQKDTEKLKAEIAETSAELQSIASKIEKLSE